MVGNDDVWRFWKFGFLFEFEKVQAQNRKCITPDYMNLKGPFFPRFSCQKHGNWDVKNQQSNQKHDSNVNLKYQS